MNMKSRSALCSIYLLIPLVSLAGDPIPGIDITVNQSPGGIVSSGTTNTAGEFTVNNLAAGDYEITLSGNGQTIVVGKTQQDRIRISNTRAAVKPVRLELSRYQGGNDLFIRKRPGRTNSQTPDSVEPAARASDYNSSRSNKNSADVTYQDDDSDDDGILAVRETGGNTAVQAASEASSPGMVDRRRVEVLKSNRQGDPDANRYDFANNDMDQDCDSDTGTGVCANTLDPDSDDDGLETAEVAPTSVDNDCSGIAEVTITGNSLTVALSCEDRG